MYRSLVGRGYLFLVYDGILKAPRPAASKFRKPSQKHGQMSSALDEFKKPIEDWACALVDGKPMENLLILYKLLYALGCRIDGIDFEIDRLCVAAIKKASSS